MNKINKKQNMAENIVMKQGRFIGENFGG